MLLGDAQAYFIGEQTGDGLGSTVLIERENSGGYSRYWIGAPYYSDSEWNEGALYQLEGNGW
jgi:hypothetical protein